MSYNFFAYIARMRYIGRWSLMRNALPENIQEHSHMVAVLAHALGVIRRDVFGVPCDPDEAAAVALYHDCSEILTGDLPTPIKYHSPEIHEAYRQVEELACEKLLATLPEKLRITARLRVEHPEATLAELAEMFDPPVSKSAVNHRMRKLAELAKE